MVRKILLTAIIVTVIGISANGQSVVKKGGKNVVIGSIQENGDTLLMSNIEEVYIFSLPGQKSRRDLRRYRKLIRNVKRVYPYAKMAGEKYQVVSAHMLNLKTERERKEYIKQVEKEIMYEYEDDLKKLTISQGRLLLKLIDRETGETSFALLKDFKGSFNAIFWQTLARIFGHNLKSEFDPQGEDRLLNEIVIMIERGQL